MLLLGAFLVNLVVNAVSAAPVTAPPPERKLYVGSDSTEAALAFEAFVQFKSAGTPTKILVDRTINAQLTHLFGPLGDAKAYAVPKGEHQVANVRVTALSPGLWRADYSYNGRIVVKNGPTTSLEVILPVDPATAFYAGVDNGRNLCTDPHYQTPQYFWYFWNPRKLGCKMVEGRDYMVLSGRLQRLPNTEQTFPEYERLADANGVIRVSVMMGMNDSSLPSDPNLSTDVNADNFRQIQRTLLASGWTSRVLTARDIATIVKVPLRTVPYVEEFSKRVVQANTRREFQLVLRIMFGPSGLYDDSAAFHWFFKDGLENSAVFIYDGHSGLGSYLDVGQIEQLRGFKFQLPRDRYQIYFFNGCSTYPYYNSMFFERKMTPQDPRGSKNLDIFTNGLSTYFYTMGNSNLVLLDGIEMWANGRARLSYQQMARKIDSGNLFGVNGDEDNPTR